MIDRSIRSTPLLRNLTLRGGEGVITWGWHTAAVFRAWSIAHVQRGGFTLSAVVQRADAFQLRQQGLYFNAPRKGGYWCWPIVAITVGPKHIVATLGPPEQ